MPNPLTHVLINTALFFPLRKKLGKYWLVFSILSGLLLDLDFVLGWILNYFGLKNSIFLHGGLVHSFGFIFILGIIALLIYLKNKEYGKYAFILVIGAILHLSLDFILGGGAFYLTLFWPFTLDTFRLHLLEQYRLYSIYGLLDAFLIFVFTFWYYLKLRKTKKSS